MFDGLAIYNTLLGHGARVTATVDGLAASIASVIVMAASEISMGDNAMLMIHNPSTLITGDSNEMRKMADTMDKVKSSMITAYRRHSSLSVENIGALMDAETWMTATEAVDKYGFAEEVIEPSEDDDDLAAAVRTPIFARFRRVPPRIAQIAARYAPRDDDDDERRRRTLRLRTLELHEMQEARVARPHPEDAGTRTRGRCSDASHLRRSRRRRIMANRDRELREWRLKELAARGGGSVDEGRRRILAERAKEIAAWAPVVFKSISCGAGGRVS